MRYFVLFLLMLSFVSVVDADCQDNQIDINSASVGELEKLSGIGPVKAQAIIDTRPFNFVGDLIKVYGIGEKTLEKIKVQRLACVEGENVKVDEKPDEKIETPNEKPSIEKKEKIIILTPKKEKIVLNGVVEDSEEVVYESKNSKILKYTPYAFSVFLIFVIVVMIFDK